MCSCTGWEGRLWNFLYGLSVCYTVHIHATVRRSFSLSLSFAQPRQSQTSFSHISLPSIMHLLFYHTCAAFSKSMLAFCQLLLKFFSALNPLIWRMPKLMRWTEPNHFRHCWFSEMLSSAPELLLTLKKSSFCLLECISDLCLLLPIWSTCFCHATAWAVLPHRISQGFFCAVLGVNVTLTDLSAP